MSEPVNKAVFLSYASQDAEAARRICEALRAGGVEVWFDADGGLEHGDEWDAKIRRQIKECVLFIPVISANTQARHEGYFRIEWDLAAERARGIASGVPFILPVVIDDTREPDALVPDRFRAVQWTRLRAGEVPPDVQQRFLKLWSHRTGVLKHEAGVASDSSRPPEDAGTMPARPKPNRRGPVAAWTAGAVVAIATVAAIVWLRHPAAESPGQLRPDAAATPQKFAAPLTEAQKLVAQARQIYEAGDELDRENLLFADELVTRALTLDSTESRAWELGAALSYTMLWHSIDTSGARQDLLLRQAARARALAPESTSARLAMAMARLGVIFTNAPLAQRKELGEIERELLDLTRLEPRNWRVQRALGTAYRLLDRPEESIRAHRLEVEFSDGHPTATADLLNVLIRRNRFDESEAILGPALARRATARLLTFDLMLKIRWRGDLAGARAALATWPGWLLQEDRGAFYAWQTRFFSREPQAALATAQRVPRDYLRDHIFSGPRAVLTARAHELAGNREAALADWRTVLQLADRELAASPGEAGALYWKAWALARLGDQAGAATVSALLQQRRSIAQASFFGATSLAPLWATLGRADLAFAELRAKLTASADSIAMTRAMLELDPAFDGVRNDPQFQELVAQSIAPAPLKPAAAKATNAPGAPDSSAEAAAKADPKTVAVLPFTNQSEDKANEFFSDGISEALAGVLGEVSGLQVAGWNSALALKGKNLPEAEVAQKLGVVYVVTGSVQKVGSQVKISARLVSAADGFQVWSDRFTREVKDIFAVQDEIAGLIARSLQLKLGVGSRRARVVNPEAHRLVLEGRHFWNQRNDDGFARAEAAFLKAIEIDPTFPEAHAGLAGVYVVRGTYQALENSAREITEDFRRARSAATKAVELGPDLAEAHAVLGYTLFNQGERTAAGHAFEKALTLNPNSAATFTWSGLMACVSGRLDTALGSYAKAATLDPLWFINLHMYAEALFYAARYEEALRIAERAAALRSDTFIPNFSLRAQILFALGRRTEALAVARTIRTQLHLDTRWTADAQAIYVLRQCGEVKEAADFAVEALRQLEGTSPTRAHIFAALGDLDKALPTIGGTRMTMRRYLFWDPIWDPWRDDPRFNAALAQLGCTDDYKIARETLARLKAQASAQK